MRNLAVVLALTVGCGKGGATSAEPAGPAYAQIRRDLVGVTFFYEYGVGGGRRWTVMDEEINGLSIKDRLTDSKGGTEEVHVSLALLDTKATPHVMIQGVLVMDYRKFDQGWRLQGVWPQAGGRPMPGSDVGQTPFSWRTQR